mmetsp:Transcript_26728/g.26377  ORF Transcript_26728/g.26377 Transcript_26728/m.26377 type:complete len:106 (-) Transcript_26728:543-860(-)
MMLMVSYHLRNLDLNFYRNHKKQVLFLQKQFFLVFLKKVKSDREKRVPDCFSSKLKVCTQLRFRMSQTFTQPSISAEITCGLSGRTLTPTNEELCPSILKATVSI